MKYPRLGLRGPHLPNPDAELDAAKWLSFLTTNRWPALRQQMREANPDLTIAWEMMPQFGTQSTSQAQWDIRHQITQMADQADFWLRRADPDGEALVEVWGHPVLDFSRTYVRVNVQQAIADWLTTGPGKDIDVMVFDLFFERWYRPWLGGHENQLVSGGKRIGFETFQQQWAEETAWFAERMKSVGKPIIVGGDSFACISGANGIKMEDALHRFESWNQEYVGLAPRQRGLLWAEERFGSVEHTIFEAQWWPSLSVDAEFALATCLLTDAIFMFNVLNTEGRDITGVENPHPIMRQFAELDLGEPQQEPVVYGDGQVYVREFERGTVVVYPNERRGEIHPRTFDRMRAFNDAWNDADTIGKARLMEGAVRRLSDDEVREVLSAAGIGGQK